MEGLAVKFTITGVTKIREVSGIRGFEEKETKRKMTATVKQ